MKQIHVALGDHLDLLIQDGTIMLVPTAREYRLDELLAGISKRNLHGPVDFGAPVGREAW